MPQPLPLGTRPALAQVDAVMAQVDAGQHHLPITRLDQPDHLGGDLPRRPAAHYRTDVRDNAIAAIEQTAVLHLDKGALVAVETRDAVRTHRHAERGQLLDE